MTRLPKDFNADAYLRLAAAGIDAVKHYIKFGHREARLYRESGRNKSLEFVLTSRSPQAIVDIFEGEWSTKFPEGIGAVTSPGHADLFRDPRIQVVNESLGPVEETNVLEIGPLEGGHTYWLHSLGAASITAVEINRRAFLKCLCVKEIFGLDRAKFLLGDAVVFLEETDKRFDIIVTSGVLYHMADPERFLDVVPSRSDRVYM